MNKTKKLIVVMLFSIGAVFLCAQEVVEAIVAIVNDDIISLSQYKQNHEALYQMLKSQLQGEEFDRQYAEYKKRLLDTMITDLLLLQEAKRRDLDVTEQIEMLIDNLKKENNFETDEQLIRAMQQQGVEFEQWKIVQKENYMKEGVIYLEVRAKIVLDDSEIVSYYKQHRDEFTEPPEYRLRAIYLSNDGRSEEEVRAKMKEIDEKIAAGEEMAALAGQYSEGPEKESQGDLGSFKKGELSKTLEQAVENLKAGEMASWVQMGNGWYLLRLEERKEERLRAFEEVRGEIEKKLFDEQYQNELKEYIEQLKKGSYIKILIPNPLEY